MGIIGNKGELKMLDKMEVYYFSPTGGTKKVSSIFADAMEKEVIWHDLGSKEPMMEKMRMWLYGNCFRCICSATFHGT